MQREENKSFLELRRNLLQFFFSTQAKVPVKSIFERSEMKISKLPCVKWTELRPLNKAGRREWPEVSLVYNSPHPGLCDINAKPLTET